MFESIEIRSDKQQGINLSESIYTAGELSIGATYKRVHTFELQQMRPFSIQQVPRVGCINFRVKGRFRGLELQT